MGKLNFCKTCGSMQLEEAKDKIEKLLIKEILIPTRCGLCDATISDRQTRGSSKKKNVIKVRVEPEIDGNNAKGKKIAKKKRTLSSLVKKSDDTGTLDMRVDDDVEMIEVPIWDATDDADGETDAADGEMDPAELSSDGDNNNADCDDNFEPEDDDDHVEGEAEEEKEKDVKVFVPTVNKTLLAPDVLATLGNAADEADLVVPQCKFCQKNFCLIHHLMAHIAEKHKEVNKITEPYQCPNCQLRFPKVKPLKRHLETQHKRVYTCEICNKTSTQANFLEKHAKTHDSKPMFRCPELYCAKQFKSKKDLQRHEMIHTGQKPNVCDTCGRGFIRTADLKAHKRIHTGDYIYCTLCDTFRTNRNSNLRKHMQEQHINKQEERKPLVKNHMCELCGGAYASNGALKKHIVSMHTKEKLFSCDQCDYKTTHRSNVQSHIKIVHKKLRPYKCRFCEKSFGIAKTRNVHQRIHTGEKPYTCEFCGKSFRRTDGYKAHRQLHVADYKCECDICGFKTIRPQSLKRHKEKHHSQESMAFNCKKCNMSFTNPQTLRAHNKEHKGGVEYVVKKAHQCTICDFSVNNQRALTKHVKRCHMTDATQYECGYCHKKFNTGPSCENHVEKFHMRYFLPAISKGETTTPSNPTVTAAPIKISHADTTSDITAEAISSILVPLVTTDKSDGQVPTSASATVIPAREVEVAIGSATIIPAVKGEVAIASATVIPAGAEQVAIASATVIPAVKGEVPAASATVIPAGEEEVAAAAAVLGMLPGGYPPGLGQVAVVSSEVTVPFSK